MTAQISDTIKFNKSQFNLIGFTPSQPFSPQDYGYKPVPESTACYRGYMCDYVLETELVLNGLTLNHQANSSQISKKLQPPDLYHVKATLIEGSPVGIWRFDELKMPIRFSGAIVIGKDPLSDPVSQFGSYQIFRYAHLIEIVTDSGKIQAISDLSLSVNSLQEQFRKATEKAKIEFFGADFIEKHLSPLARNYTFL